MRRDPTPGSSHGGLRGRLRGYTLISDPKTAEEEQMSETISVEVARYRERDLLGKALEERGYKATPVEELGRLGFDIECDDGTCDDVLQEMEGLVQELQAAFIPIRGNGFVFLRPPGD